MALVDIWKSSPAQLTGKTVQQMLVFAGTGRLGDGNTTSLEFRQYLAHIPSHLLTVHANQCLDTQFPDNGFALQDIVNQIGHRLGFTVEAGRYRGNIATIGFDGVWRSADGAAMLIEVKTSSSFRVPLDVAANYRTKLIQLGALCAARSSILLVVGRDDTADLEAQIRGSRHAWDVRLISVEALLRLLRIKEQIEDQRTVDRIRDILMPQEFTRVDGIIDLVFSAAAEAASEGEGEAEEHPAPDGKTGLSAGAFRDSCIARLQAHLRESLVRQTATISATPDGKTAALCSISKAHERKSGTYWFKFRPAQKETLERYENALVAFGCGSAEQILAIPFAEFSTFLDRFNTTKIDGSFYWHVHVNCRDRRWMMLAKGGRKGIDVTRFLLRS